MPNAPIRPSAPVSTGSPAVPGSLHAYVLRALLAVAIGPLVLLSMVNCYQAATRQQREAAGRLEAIARHLASGIDDHIERHVKAVESCANLCSHEGGRPADLQRTLNHLSAVSGFAEMLVGDWEGRIVAASPRAGPLSTAGRAALAEASRTGRTLVSDVFRAGAYAEPVLAVSAPFTNPSGQPAGVVQGILGTASLARLTREYRGSGLTVVVMDRRDRVIHASPDSGFNPLDEAAGSLLVRDARAAGGPVFRHRRQFLGVSIESATGWRVMLMLPLARLRVHTYQLLLAAGLWLAAAVVLCLALARITAWRLARPLRRLVTWLRHHAEGYDSRLEKTGFEGAPAEIRELAAGVERMAAKVAQARRELEARVEARTRELQLEVADRVRAQAKLELRDRAMAVANEGIVITDYLQPDNPLIYVNSGFERITGYSAAEVVGGNCRMLQGPDSDPAQIRELHHAIRECRAVTVEILNYRKDGTPFWNRLSITPIRNDAGVVTHFIGVQSDITQSKEIERLKNDLIATVNHELRTPVTCLQGFAELMLTRQYPPDKQRQFLMIVHNEAVRLARLVDNFADLQQMVSGAHDIHLEPVQVEPLVRELVDDCASIHCAHDVVARIDPDLPAVPLDAERVRRALTSLLDNAVKFSPDGGAITVSVLRRDDAVVFCVADEGIGIPAEAIPKLFTRFYQVDNTETRTVGGAGLSLELVRRVAEAHGGRVWAESEPGRGSRFYFEVPCGPPAHSRLTPANP